MDAMGLGKTLEALLHIRLRALAITARGVITKPTLILAPSIAHEDWITMAERMGLDIILYHGENDRKGSARRKDIRATLKQWGPASEEQRQKNPGQVLRNKKFDKYFNSDKLETITSFTIILTTLHTWRLRTLVEEEKLDEDGERNGESSYSNRFVGLIHRIILDEAHIIRPGSDSKDNLMWWAIYTVHAKFRWSMSASPMFNRAANVKALLGILFREEWNQEADDAFNIPGDFNPYELEASDDIRLRKLGIFMNRKTS